MSALVTVDQQRYETAKKLTQNLVLTEDKLREVMKKLSDEFNLGLRDERKAVVKMFITYVRNLPTGEESGPFLALDLGGTNFRVLLITLDGKRADTKSTVYPIEDKLRVGEGSKLFDHIAECLFHFITTNKITIPRIPLGFTFSFPCRQLGLTTSELVRWTKGYQCSGVVDHDVVRLLRQAISRKQPKSQVFVDVVAVINDTTGTLLSCAHSNKDCAMGLIVGTGFNLCYVERLQSIDKWTSNYTEPKQVVINCELGAFGEGGALKFIETEWDIKVDNESVNKGGQLIEKMVSGMYLGEIVRHALYTLCTNKVLFKGNIPVTLKEMNRITAKDVSKIDGLKNSDSTETRNKMKKIFGDNEMDVTDIEIIRMVCDRISTRSAHLVAVCCSTILERMKRPFCVIAYDGSVIKYHPKFKTVMKDMLVKLTNEKYKFNLMLSEDGSGKGAAVVAAVSYKEKRPVFIKRGRKVYELSIFRQYSVQR